MTGLMKTKSSSSSSQHGPVVGSSSIIMIFTVLCLTMFSALTLTQARNELSLSSYYSTSVLDYTKADENATRFLAGAYEASDKGEFIKYASDMGAEVFGSTVVYSAPVDTKQIIEVVLTESNGEIKINSWTLVYIAEWNPDRHLNVYGGNNG